jgi:ABC-type polar amino acid transport system ATPase subunit
MVNNIVVEVKNIHKYFGKHHVLRDVSFTVVEGEVVVICGPSGSGKSTLVRCINGLEKISKGTIRVHDLRIDDPNTKSTKICKEIGMVFQEFNLFPHMTVLDNIMLAPMKVKKISQADAKEIALKNLIKVGILDQANKFPAKLSGGQKQRVAIARALAMQPKLMLFDEPTSALDPEMISEVLDVMRDLAKEGMTMIIVSHEMGFAREVAGDIIFFDEGKIVEQAPPKKFFENPENERTKKFLSQIL